MSLFKPAALAVMLACATGAQAAKPTASPFDLMVESGKKTDELGGYNFSGSFKFDNVTLLATALPTRDQYPATDSGQMQYGAALRAATAAHQYGQLGADAIKAMRFDFDGAIDLQTLKLEISPTIRVNHRNLDARITFPMLIDGNDLSAIVDISAVNWMIPEESFKGVNYIKAHLSPELSAKLDVHKLVAALRQVRKDQYKSIDPESFSFSPLTPADRKLGGMFKVHLRISEQQYAQMTARLLAEFATAMKGDAPKGNQPDLSDVLNEAAKSRHAREDLDIVLNKQLQPVAMHADITARTNEIQMHAEGDIRINHFGQPEFHLHPAATEIKDIGVFPPKPVVASAKTTTVPRAYVPPAMPRPNSIPDNAPAPYVTITPPPAAAPTPTPAPAGTTPQE